MGKFLCIVITIFLLSVNNVQSTQPSFNATSPTPRISLRIYHNLPLDIHRLFNATIRFPNFHKINSALIVNIVNKTNHSEIGLDKFEFRPGHQDHLKEPFRGKYMSVLFCRSKSSEKSLELHVRFNASAKNKMFLIFYSEDYNLTLNKTTGSLIYISRISCNNSDKPEINMTIGSNEIDEQSFTNDQSIWINCSAIVEHKPRWRRVTMEGLDDFDILKQEVANVTRMLSVYTSATIKNHGKLIICRSERHFKSRHLLINHHPESVYTVPKLNSRSTIPYNTSIRCMANGGYPPPIIEWQMIIGPHNASNFYSLNNDKNVLIMHDTAPPGSKWIFECSAKNLIPLSKDFQGPFLQVYSNVPELTLEGRKIVVIVVPFVVLLLIIMTCLLKTYCFKTEQEKHIKTLLDTVPQLKDFFDASKVNQDFKVNVSNNNLSKEGSSIYSIETGIDPQFQTVLDEELYEVDQKESRSNSLPTEWIRLNEISPRHRH